MGVTKLLCPIQEANNIGLQERCDGAKSTFGNVENLQLSAGLSDMAKSEAEVQAKLTADTSIDGVFALNADIATGAAIPAAAAAGRKFTIGTVDLSADAVQAIKDGKLAFAIDQQQFAQGYLSVTVLSPTCSTGTSSVVASRSTPAPASSPRTTRTSSRSSQPPALADALAPSGRGETHPAPTAGPAPRAIAPPLPLHREGTPMSATTAAPERRAPGQDLPPHRTLRRPELGALLGALVVYALFAVTDRTGSFATITGTANWTDAASQIGIVAVPVALLMIAGEFDLSAGVLVGTSGLFCGLLTTNYGVNLWLAILLTFAFAAGIGFINGWLVMLTGLPSFIVTPRCSSRCAGSTSA